jgi:hypothetical protein
MDVNKAIEKKQLEDTLKQEFEITLQDRIERYLQVKPHGIIPNTPFARASSECSKAYRDGQFYGCISLTQSVAESLVKFLCKCNGWKPEKVFEKNIEKLEKRGIITTEQSKDLLSIWENRDDYHHLNDDVESDYLKLISLAESKLLLLNKIEKQVFDFSIDKGVLVPKNPKYWTTGNQVFLRLD